MKFFCQIASIAFFGFVASCSGGKFKEKAIAIPAINGEAGDASQAIESSAPLQKENQGVDEMVRSKSLPLVKEEDKAAISDCLKQWVKHPFTAEEIAHPKLIEISEGINNSAIIYTDSKITEKPSLFLVNFDINIGNKGQLALLNPKGWYCLHIDAKNINNFSVNVACQTQAAIATVLAKNDKNLSIDRPVSCPAE